MHIINRLQYCFVILLIINQAAGSSYNEPKFSACATWNTTAITFANASIVGSEPRGIFISINNTVYVAGRTLNQILVWTEGSSVPTRNISGNLNSPYATFATINGDIYVDNGAVNHRVDKWSWNATSNVIVMSVTSRCISLFVDINQTLYCSNDGEHKVVKISLNSGSLIPTLAAGIGFSGSQPNMFSTPNGVFVDRNFSLYVADYGNDRIQRFRLGEQNATTIAGSGASGTITLDGPTAIVLDADEYLFITDFNNNRIIRSGPLGFYCFLGCTGQPGAASNQLRYPQTLRFDNHGNLFVVDLGNSRIQKFLLTTNSCVPSHNQPKFSSCATWNPNAITIANSSLVGIKPTDVFVDINNNIYVPNYNDSLVQIWSEGNTIPTRTISGGLNLPFSVFVTLNGDVYIDNSVSNHRIDKWTLNANTSVVTMYVSGKCFGIFIDIEENLYCCMDAPNQVIKQSLNKPINTSTIVAGNGTSGSSSYTLSSPRGIFVDKHLNLYVADCGNHRIQLFRSGQLNGSTVIINGTNGVFTLNCPAEVVLDIDGYLFIADGHNNRILGSGPTGFRCIVGCTGTSGTAPNQLANPHSLSFDSYGNLFIIEYANNRLQKFFLSSNSCEISTNAIQSTALSATTMETRISTDFYLNAIQSSHSFYPPACSVPIYIGSSCNISNSPCNLLKPCQNNGTCINDNNTLYGYNCSCPPGFTNAQCQYHDQFCLSNICWNDGTCYQKSNTTFVCYCIPGWTNTHCQTLINYCGINTCYNRGVCLPRLLNYTCLCLDGSYSGSQCQIISNRIKILEIISKSFAYIAIIAILTVILFIVILDVLKYCFGIDPIDSKRKESEKSKRQNHKRKKKAVTVIRYIYVNASQQNISVNPISTVEKTIV